MRKLKKYFLLMGSLLMFSCSTTVVPPSKNIPTPPVQTESVKPSLQKVEDGVNQSIIQTTKVDEKVKLQAQTINNQKTVIENALAEAKKLEAKLKAKETVSEAEIASLSQKIELIKKENEKLLENNGSLTETVRYLQKVLEATRQDSRITSNKLNQTEKELDILRDQNKTISSDLAARNIDVEKMQKQVLKSEKESAAAKVWRNACYFIGGIFILWTIVKNVLMMYFPNTRFRI